MLPHDPKRDHAALLDIVQAARTIIEFTDGMTAEDLSADRKTQYAVLFQILVVGEAVKRLSPTFRLGHPEVEWIGAARMRDRVIHQYDKINLDRVWTVIQEEIPRLRDEVLAILNELGLGEIGPLGSPR
ncbi:MAG: HepT-like ribonuclease domain-containing protein [Thermomicrobiales bacterium]